MEERYGAPLTWEILDRIEEGLYPPVVIPVLTHAVPRPSMSMPRVDARASLDRSVFNGETSLIGDKSMRIADTVDEDDRTQPSEVRGAGRFQLIKEVRASLGELRLVGEGR